MKLDSKKCKERLKAFPVDTEIEDLAIKVLLSKPEITELTNAQIDKLADIIKTIKNILEIKNEAN